MKIQGTLGKQMTKHHMCGTHKPVIGGALENFWMVLGYRSVMILIFTTQIANLGQYPIYKPFHVVTSHCKNGDWSEHFLLKGWNDGVHRAVCTIFVIGNCKIMESYEDYTFSDWGAFWVSVVVTSEKKWSISLVYLLALFFVKAYIAPAKTRWMIKL